MYVCVTVISSESAECISTEFIIVIYNTHIDKFHFPPSLIKSNPDVKSSSHQKYFSFPKKVYRMNLVKHSDLNQTRISLVSTIMMTIIIHFRRDRKISKSDYWLRLVCLYFCPSVSMEQLGSHSADFYEI